MLDKVKRYGILAYAGGSAYLICELLFRGWTSLLMFPIGALCFILIGGLNNWFDYGMPLVLQMTISAAIVTFVEFVSGCILNIWLELGIWDYSAMWGNLLGQICPAFSLCWFALSLPCIVIDDWLRYEIDGEERPHYSWFRWVRKETDCSTQTDVGESLHEKNTDIVLLEFQNCLIETQNEFIRRLIEELAEYRNFEMSVGLQELKTDIDGMNGWLTSAERGEPP